MTALVIDSAIPLPPPGSGRPISKEVVAMRSMEVGQSFRLSDESAWTRVRRQQTRDPAKKYAIRKEGEGWRIWRIK